MEDALGSTYTELWDTRSRVLLDRLFDLLFCLYVFTTIFLPSGSIYGLNLKLPVYLLLLPLAIRRFFQQSRNVATLAMMFAIPSLLALWVMEGSVNAFPVSGAIRQYMDFMLTFLMCWLVFVFCDEQQARRLRFLRLVLQCELATCLLKAGIILYALARGIPVVEVVRTVAVAFGANLMTMDLGALFGRVQFVSDALIPLCLFIVLRHRDRLEIGYLRAFTTILLLLVSVVFSFSRYFWAYTAIAFVMGLLLGQRDRFKAGLLILMAVVILISLPLLTTLYEVRFSEAVAGSSDTERTDQAKALQQFFLDAPLLGHGLGSYSTLVLRSNDSETVRYSYEMQLLALAGQTGIVGIALFLILLAWYYRRLFAPGPLSKPDRLGLGILLVIWLAAGLYNPLLESPVASVSYASLMTMSALAETSKRKEPFTGTPPRGPGKRVEDARR